MKHLPPEMSESVLLKKCDIPVGISNMIRCDTFSSCSKLIRVTGYVIKFVQALLSRIKEKKDIKPISNVLTAQELSKAEQVWLIDVQRLLKQDPKFAQLKVQLHCLLMSTVLFVVRADYLMQTYITQQSIQLYSLVNITLPNLS